jgi:predicted phage terminase large subunit-like protein
MNPQLLIDYTALQLSGIFKTWSDEELLQKYNVIKEYSEALEVDKKRKLKEKRLKYKEKPFVKELAREKLINFCTYTKDDYEVNDHHEIVAEYLDLWVQKKIKKLIIVEPPRHGKSEQSSRRLPAKILGNNPNAKIINVAHTASLARSFNRNVQRIIDSDSYQELFPNTKLHSKGLKTAVRGSNLRNSDMFEIVDHEGYYCSSGIDSNVVGKGADYLILDDLVKGVKEAFSKVTQKFIWEQYQASLSTRLEKDGSILILTTRWNENDLVGKLLREEGDEWVVLSFPLIKDTPLNHNDYDFREEGEVLWENKYNLEFALKIRENTSRYWWASLWQGKPVPEGGSVIKEDWFGRYDRLPDKKEWIRVVQSWDTAFEVGEENDYSVCSTWLETKTRYYLLHVWRKRVTFPELKKQVPILYEKFKPPGEIGMEVIIEQKSSGHSLIQEMRTTHIPVKAIKVDRSKKIRLEAASPTIEAGKVLLPYDAPWLADFEEEIVQGLHGVHDDQIDTMTQAINHMKGNANYEDFLARLDEAAKEVVSGSLYDRVKDGDWAHIQGIDENDEQVLDWDKQAEEEENAYERVMKGHF